MRQSRELELRQARLSARLANEVMDREGALADFATRNVHQPLEDVWEELALWQDAYRAEQALRRKGKSGSGSGSGSCSAEVSRWERSESVECGAAPMEDSFGGGNSLDVGVGVEVTAGAVPFETTDAVPCHWLDLETRLAVLQSNMFQTAHATLPDLRSSCLGPLEEEMDRNRSALASDRRADRREADRRYGLLVRRAEQWAATMSRRYHEERAARKAALSMAESSIRELQQVDDKRASEFLDTIRQLREQLDREREERVRRDEEIRRDIESAVQAMKRSVLGLLDDAADDTSWEEYESDFNLLRLE